MGKSQRRFLGIVAPAIEEQQLEDLAAVNDFGAISTLRRGKRRSDLLLRKSVTCIAAVIVR
jgi:hypothetical protein